MTAPDKKTADKIQEVVSVCQAHGGNALVALAGVPGSGKSFIALQAARQLATQKEMITEIQFSPTWSYEEFIEGMRLGEGGKVEYLRGLLLEVNRVATADSKSKYVLLIEELTRANLASVLGELLTFIEYRDRAFTTIYQRQKVSIAKNLIIIGTYNPTDRSAIEMDGALMRRLRIISFPPSVQQLEEMLNADKADAAIIKKLVTLFEECQKARPDDWHQVMPFGHGIFAGVKTEGDLKSLWQERIIHFLRRPLLEPHPMTDVIEKNYPWK
jgi:5-methylcytosine-specific restriction endonuclease McrBC GTP-binding regulatory subunit McrB